MKKETGKQVAKTYNNSITESWDSIHIIAFLLWEISMLPLELKWLSRLNESKY